MNFNKVTPDDITYPDRKMPNIKIPASYPLIIVLIAIFFIAITSFYTIEPSEVGVVLRLGKFIATTKPGLHFKLPFGIDKAYPVKVEYIYKSEFGYRTQTAGVKSTYQQRGYEDESLMLTGDLNVLDLEWIVQFKISKPFNVLFVVRDVDKTLRDISESVMRHIVGDYSFNEVLTAKRLEINDRVQQKLQEILDSYDVGLQIVTVKLQDVNPPDLVKPAFNEVNEAKQEREKLINQAWGVYNQKIPQASGEALKIVKEAEGYALEKINMAEGDAKRFTLLRDAYIQSKDITRKRLYLEKMSGALARAGKKYIIDPDQKGIIPLLNLDNE